MPRMFVGWFYGMMPLGRVDHIAGCSIATCFKVFNAVPLIPVGSFIELSDPRWPRSIPIPLHRRSVRVAYFRVWILVFMFGALAATTVHPLAIVAVIVLAATSAYAWLVYGHLSRSEKRQRLAYATWLGVPIDPALLPSEIDLPFAAVLRAFVDERTAHAPESYRGGLDAPWRSVAMESDDAELLIAALTLARVEQRGAESAEQASLDAVHASLWAKLEPMLAAGIALRAFLDWERHVEQPSKKLKRELGLSAALLVLGGAAATPVVLYLARPKVVIANVSGADGLTVLLDGKPVAERLPVARREGDGAFVTIRVQRGEHELVARDAKGVEIDRRRFVVAQGTNPAGAVLYAPGRAPETCFFEEIVTYASLRALRSYEVLRLDMTEPLRPFPERINRWFEDAPEEVETSADSATVVLRTVRAAPCDAMKRR